MHRREACIEMFEEGQVMNIDGLCRLEMCYLSNVIFGIDASIVLRICPDHIHVQLLVSLARLVLVIMQP